MGATIDLVRPHPKNLQKWPMSVEKSRCCLNQSLTQLQHNIFLINVNNVIQCFCYSVVDINVMNAKKVTASVLFSLRFIRVSGTSHVEFKSKKLKKN